MDISLSYELDREDYIDSQIAYNRASEAVKRNIKRTRVSMASFYLFVGLVTFPALSGIWRFVVTGAILALAVAHILSVRSLNEARVRRLAGKMLGG